MTGNTYGALKGKLTKHYRENLVYWNEMEDDRKRKEIKVNQGRWDRAIERLKVSDPEFDTWYDTDAVPEEIIWTGEKFETILKILRKRLKSVRQEK